VFGRCGDATTDRSATAHGDPVVSARLHVQRRGVSPWGIAAVMALEGCAGTVTSRAFDASRGPPSSYDPRRRGEDARADGPAPHVVELSLPGLSRYARMSDGTVRCRGDNRYGQLGQGTTDETPTDAPRTIPGLDRVVQVIATLSNAACALRDDGTVFCWGANDFGQLGIGHPQDERCGAVPRACRARPTRVEGIDEVVQLAADVMSFCAVRRSGEVWCWGSALPLLPSEGSAIPVRATLTDVAALWIRDNAPIIRLRTGTFLDLRQRGRAQIPAGAEIEGHLATGHLCYRLPDQTVRCLGRNGSGQIGNGASSRTDLVASPWDPGLRGVRSVITGSSHTCAILDDGRVSCWGDRFGLGSSGESPEVCESILGPVRCVTHPAPLAGLDEVTGLFPASWGGCALRVDRSVWCWGNEGDRTNPAVPVRVLW